MGDTGREGRMRGGRTDPLCGERSWIAEAGNTERRKDKKAVSYGALGQGGGGWREELIERRQAKWSSVVRARDRRGGER